MMNDISNQTLYHVVEHRSRYDENNQVTLYIFTDEETAVSKAREIQEENKREFESLKKRMEHNTKELCNKYEITDKDPYDINDKVYDLATEEEIDVYDNFFYKMMDSPYKNRSYCVYKYKVGEGGKVEEFGRYYAF